MRVPAQPTPESVSMRSSETIFPKLFFAPFQLPELSVESFPLDTLSLLRFLNIQFIVNHTDFPVGCQDLPFFSLFSATLYFTILLIKSNGSGSFIGNCTDPFAHL